MKEKLIDRKLSRFIIVGIINTLVGMSIMFGLYNLAGCSYWVSSAANFILTSILSYFLNRQYTFRDRGGMGGSALRFAINIAFCYLAAFGIAKPLALHFVPGQKKLQENIAMLAGLVMFTGLNYLGQRLLVFRSQK